MGKTTNLEKCDSFFQISNLTDDYFQIFVVSFSDISCAWAVCCCCCFYDLCCQATNITNHNDNLGHIPVGKMAEKQSAGKRTPSDCFFGNFAHWVVPALFRNVCKTFVNFNLTIDLP